MGLSGTVTSGSNLHGEGADTTDNLSSYSATLSESSFLILMLDWYQSFGNILAAIYPQNITCMALTTIIQLALALFGVTRIGTSVACLFYTLLYV